MMRAGDDGGGLGAYLSDTMGNVHFGVLPVGHPCPKPAENECLSVAFF